MFFPPPFTYLLPPRSIHGSSILTTRSHVRPPPETQVGYVGARSTRKPKEKKEKEHALARLPPVNYLRSLQLSIYRHARLFSFPLASSIFFYGACRIKMQSKQVERQTSDSPFFMSPCNLRSLADNNTRRVKNPRRAFAAAHVLLLSGAVRYAFILSLIYSQLAGSQYFSLLLITLKTEFMLLCRLVSPLPQ